MEYLLLLIPLGIFFWAYFVTRAETAFVRPEVSPAINIDTSAYEAAPSLFVNASEAGLFNHIRDHLPPQYHIHSKVRLEDIIRVKHTLREKARWAARGRVKSRHVDYLITNRAGQIVLAIELDGRAHDARNPSEADKVKTALFKAAGVPLRRYRVGNDFDLIAATIASELNAS